MKKLIITIFAITIVVIAFSETGRYRVMFNNDATTAATIAWEQLSGDEPKLYIGTKDHGIKTRKYSTIKEPDVERVAEGMDNRFVRLKNLKPNTAYYFVVKDDNSTSERYWFKTCPDDPSIPLAIVAGGDSRTNSGNTSPAFDDPHRIARRNCNILVSKLRPHAVMFGGDMVNKGGNHDQWKAWFDDWQFTFSEDNRIFPVLAVAGNHEWYTRVNNLFDIGKNEYYKVTFGGNLLSVYNLNSEQDGDHPDFPDLIVPQGEWLNTDLPNDPAIWKIAQYHKPIYPHVEGKEHRKDLLENWVQPFYDHGVRLLVECDAHTIKTTWPVKPIIDSNGNVAGLKKALDDPKAITFVGEGTWGAPDRPNKQTYSFTRDVPSMKDGVIDIAINWIFISECKIETRKVYAFNAEEIEANNHDKPMEIPAGLDILKTENTPTGVITITRKCGQ